MSAVLAAATPAAPAPAAPAPAAPAPAAAAPAAPAPAAAPAAAAPAAPAAPAPAAPAAAPAPAPAAPAAAKKAPESYADFTLAADQPAMHKDLAAQVKATAKALDLSQAEAQRLVTEIAPALAKSEGARITDFVTKRADEWRASSLTDAEVGGAKFEENRALAMKTFEVFGTPELAAVLNKTGLGDNPEVLRWALRVGRAIGPDNKFVAGTTLTKQGVAPEDRLWPDKK